MLLNIVLNKILKNISVYYYLQKRQCLLKCQKKVKLSVKWVSIKVSKTPDSSSIQLKKYTHLKCLLQIYCSAPSCDHFGLHGE